MSQKSSVSCHSLNSVMVLGHFDPVFSVFLWFCSLFLMSIGLFGLVFGFPLCPCFYCGVCSGTVFPSFVFCVLLIPSYSSLFSASLSVYCVVFKVHILVSVFSVSCPPCSVMSNCLQLCSPCVPTSLITFCVFMSECPFVLCCVVPLGCVHFPCLPSASSLVSPSIVLYDFLCSC